VQIGILALLLMGAVLSIYHDTRRKKESGLYPVKIRVFSKSHKKETKFYATGIDLSKDDFKASYVAEKPKAEKHRQAKIKLNSLLVKAINIAEELNPFDFERFEKQMFRPASSVGNVFYYYDNEIKLLYSEDRISTASNYELSKKSIVSFLESIGKPTNHLSFETITKDFLNRYEKWMVKEERTLTTVGIYIRPLRAIFNKALLDGEISKEIYPFGKDRYKIPTGSNIKKALSKEDLKKLFDYNTEDINIIKARAFWFFSYLCNGMNIRDICELKYKNVHKETISFVRTKTKRTTKDKQAIIEAAILPLTDEVIRIYGNQKVNGETYVFPIFTPSMPAKEKHAQTQRFTKYINTHMKKLAKLVGVDENISTYYARHSYSTISVRSGASVEFIQKSLGHQNIQTTMNYLAKLDHDSIKKNANNLMDF